MYSNNTEGNKISKEDVLKLINDYVEEMRQYERISPYGHGFLQGVEMFAEYLKEKLTK